VESGLVFCNLVDFDMLYGHRRDPGGYRRALEEFDQDLRPFEANLRAQDVVLLTADHGNDPTFLQGTDHTREYVPLVAFGPEVRSGVDLGTRSSFADIGATIEDLFGLDATARGSAGTSFADELRAR
jgi:phosphopentomutase